MEWFIQLHRKMLDWEWYKNGNVFTVFIHCLLKANWKDKKWEWTLIKRWEFITSYQNLANELSWKHNKFTVMQVRTALKKLNITWEITIKTTNKFTIVKVNNYNTYQVNNTEDNNQITNKQQSNNNQITTTNKDNKDNKDNKEINKAAKIKIFEPSSFEYRITEFFIEEHLKLQNPSFIYLYNKNWKEKLINKWGDEIRKMREIDKYTEEQIDFIIKYLFQNDFWVKQISSMEKFRKKNKSWVLIFSIA